MVAIERTAAILLAAGLSRRFGAEDKLLSDHHGRPLVDHAAATLAGLPCARHIAVVRVGAPKLRALLEARGFAVVENDAPETGMARSLALGIMAAGDAEAALIALGDMPAIPAAHLAALCARLSPDAPIAATAGPSRPMVPAAFVASVFARLQALTGDRGAQDVLADVPTVALDPALLFDIDCRAAPEGG